jgi:transcription antitermination factor NusG
MTQEWFAIRTRSNRENVVSEALTGKGYEVLFPRYRGFSSPRTSSQGARSRRNEQRRSNSVLLKPLFPGYLFCRFDVVTRLPILTVPGVLNVVSNGKVPIPIDNSEIDSLRVLMNSNLPIGPYPYLKVGDLVMIANGPLAGAQGSIIQTDCKRLIVSITLLQRSVAVDVAGEWLEKLPARPEAALLSGIVSSSRFGGEGVAAGQSDLRAHVTAR